MLVHQPPTRTCKGVLLLCMAGSRLPAARKPLKIRKVSMAGSDTFTRTSIQGCSSSALYHCRCSSGHAKPRANMQCPNTIAMHAIALMPCRASKHPTHIRTLEQSEWSASLALPCKTPRPLNSYHGRSCSWQIGRKENVVLTCAAAVVGVSRTLFSC